MLYYSHAENEKIRKMDVKPRDKKKSKLIQDLLNSREEIKKEILRG